MYHSITPQHSVNAYVISHLGYFTSLKPSAVLQISVKAVLYVSFLMVFRFIYQNGVSKPERFSKDGKARILNIAILLFNTGQYIFLLKQWH